MKRSTIGNGRQKYRVLALSALLQCLVPALHAETATNVADLQRQLTVGGPSSLEAGWQLADIYSTDGKNRLALDVLDRVDAAGSRAPTALRRGSALHGLGSYELAADALDRLDRNALSDVDQLAWRLARGNVYVELGDANQARTLYAEAAQIARQAKLPALETRARLNGVRAQLEEGNIARVEVETRTILILAATIDDVAERSALQVSLAELARRLNQEYGAPATLRGVAFDALTRARSDTTDAYVRATATGLLGALYEDEGRLAEALTLTNEARFLSQSAQAQEQLYRWEWQAGRILRAQGDIGAAQQAYQRAVEGLDVVRSNFPVGSKQVFARLIAPVYSEYAEVMLREASTLVDAGQRQARLTQVRDVLETLKEAEVQDYFGNDCVAQRTTAENAQLRDERAAVLYPVFLNDRVEVLLELNNGIAQFTVPVTRNQITQRIRQLRTLLESDTSGDTYLPPAQDLYRWLVEPAEAVLAERGVKTLVVVPEGALRTVPLAALHDGKQFLIERFAVATTPAIALTRVAPAQAKGSVVFGGLTQAVESEGVAFAALPNVEAEMQLVSSLYAGEWLQDETFKLKSVEQALATPGLSIAHFATHGEFNRDHRKSFLLTYDERLTLNDLQSVLEQRGPDQRLDLLVLSACRTAAGDDRAALGLAGVAIQSGVESAVASLWYISDAATAQLVGNFYRQLKTGAQSKAESLRQAQLALIHNERFQHPSFWAPYLLIGSWL